MKLGNKIRIFFLLVTVFSMVPVKAVDWTGKKVSICGDSYSAFGTNQHYPGRTDVRSESQMWWAQVISHFGGELEVNGSRSGSAISYTYGVCPSIPYLAQDGKLGNPDIIMVMGGLNDFWMLGVDEATFRVKVNAFFDLLDAGYARAEKIFVLNKIHSNVDAKWGLAPMYRNVLRELSRSRGYRIVDLEGYMGIGDGDFDSPEYPHPTLQGQTKIAQRVISSLENDKDYIRMLDCLEMDNSGYMVTDYVPNLATTEIMVRMRIFDGGIAETNVLYYASGYAAGNENASNVLSLVWSSGGIRYLNSTDGGLTNVGPKLSVTPDADGDVVEVVTVGNTMTVGEYSLASHAVASNVQASGNLVIGAMREGGSPGAAFVGMGPKKIYNIRIKENGIVVRDYVPALNLEGKATLYDKVTGVCLGVYGGGDFNALDFDEGPYANYSQYRAYANLYEAYAAANSGEVIVVRDNPSEVLSITGRVDVAIDTRGFANIEMLSPSIEYKVFRNGTVYYIGKNDDLIPRFACNTISDLFVPVNGKLKLHIGNVLAGCTYSVYVTTNLNDEWHMVGEGFERADFEVDAPSGARSFFIKAVVRKNE